MRQWVKPSRTIFAHLLAATTLYAVHEVERARLDRGDFVLSRPTMLQVIRPVEALGYAMQGFTGRSHLEKMLALFTENPSGSSRTRPSRSRAPGNWNLRM